MKRFIFTLLIGYLASSNLFSQWTLIDNNKLHTNGEDVEIRDASTPEISFFNTSLNLEEGSISAIGQSMQFESKRGDLNLLSFEDYSFSTRTGNVTNTRAVIKNNGNFGLGTSIPQSKFHLVGGDFRIEDNGRIEWRDGTTLNSTIRFSTQDLYITNSNPSGHLFLETKRELRLRLNGITKLMVDDTGNVGIHTLAPAYDFQVAGNMDVTGEFSSASDKRLKRDFKKIDNALEKLSNLKPVSYYFRHDEFPEMHLSERRKMGLIAQEVVEVFPELVSDDGKTKDGKIDNLMSVNYVELIPVLIQAINDLKHDLDKSKAIINGLNVEVASLK